MVHSLFNSLTVDRKRSTAEKFSLRKFHDSGKKKSLDDSDLFEYFSTGKFA
jgi:hypothetical protein